ncbi:MAG: adenylate/guanylate cyclase domain-containing protein [Deltaproteobacteria bacterium]|nr:adenylate/guanylate cyclase domain-containing protein [Deltaproteobacteria bacterium]
MFEHLLFPLEISLAVSMMCGLHALKPRVGLAPFFGVIGLLEAYLFITGQANVPIAAQMIGSVADVGSMLFVPLVLTAGVLLYTLEGTSTARSYVVAVVVLFVVHGLIERLLFMHAASPPVGMASAIESEIVSFRFMTRVGGLAAILADLVVIVVVYQALHNRMRALPLGVPLYIALVVAMGTDAVVFALVSGKFSIWGLRMPQKLEAGFFAGLPLAAYLSWKLRHVKDELRGGILDRGALELLDLRQTLGKLEATLKEQRAQFLYIKDTFSRYVSPAVVDALVADPTRLQLGGDLKDVTVLFTDIRGYSTLSEQMTPTETITLLNRYFEGVSNVILERDGMINEFEGDGILAVFGAPLDMVDHADRAIEAALAMLEAVDVLNVEWEKDGTAEKWKRVGLDKLRVRIGIHSGPVVAGNVGTSKRIKYAIIGDTVNTAARVEGLNKELNTTILCTEATVSRLHRLKERVRQDHGSHQVKGKAEPVHVYGFLAPQSS